MAAQGRPFSGAVLQLGRQDIHFGMDDLRKWADLHRFPLANIDSVLLSTKADFRDRRFIDDVTFFRSLGFNTVESCDFSDYENPTHVADLNRPVDSNLHGKYDLVFNGGTMEHIYHIPQVMENIYSLLKPRGQAVHFVPSSNHVEHGFYMFSPTFFSDYFAANKWDVNTFQFFEYTRSHDVVPWRIYNYTPGCLDHCNMGGFDRGYLLGLFVVATKSLESTGSATPQQGLYRKTWTEGREAKPSWLISVSQLLKAFPPLYASFHSLYWWWKSRKSQPKLVARY